MVEVRNHYLDDGCLTIDRLSAKRVLMERCFINYSIVGRVGEDNWKGCMTEMRGRYVPHSRRIKIDTPPEPQQVIVQVMFSLRKRPDAHRIRAPGYQQSDNQPSLLHMGYQSVDGYVQVQHSQSKGVMVYPQGNGQKGSYANYLKPPYGNARSTSISARLCWN